MPGGCLSQRGKVRRSGGFGGQRKGLGGLLHAWQGHPDQALACLRESLAIYRQLGAPFGQAETLRELGMALRALGHTQEARVHLRQAVVFFEELQSADADQVRALLAE